MGNGLKDSRYHESSTDMRVLDLTRDVVYSGAISLERIDKGIVPWRIPLADKELFESPLQGRAIMPAGVRSTIVSDTRSLRAEVGHFNPENQGYDLWPRYYDVLVDHKLHQRIRFAEVTGTITVENLPAKEKLIELWLPQPSATFISSIAIDADASLVPFRDSRPKWIVYGSSITHCREAAGPSEAWPAIVANQYDLNLISLGFGGQCHIEPMVGRMIRDLEADYISLCLGINVMIHETYAPRTFRAAVIGLLTTIRDRHERTPIALVSSICNPPREQTPNRLGLTLVDVRRVLWETVELFRSRGDDRMFYISGLDLFGPEYLPFLPDQLHPNAEGYRLLAKRYSKTVMPHFGLSPVR